MRLRGKDLVRAAFAKLGVTTNREFGQKLDELDFLDEPLDRQGGDKLIRNWLSGVNEPNFQATIAMLKAAGWLDEAGLEAALKAAEEAEAAEAADPAGATAADAARAARGKGEEVAADARRRLGAPERTRQDQESG